MEKEPKETPKVTDYVVGSVYVDLPGSIKISKQSIEK